MYVGFPDQRIAAHIAAWSILMAMYMQQVQSDWSIPARLRFVKL